MNTKNLQPTSTIQTSAPAYSITQISLSNFRNYSDLSLKLSSSPVVLTGANGSGKTNILEAISFLSPGRGLRNIKLDEADRQGLREKVKGKREEELSYRHGPSFTQSNYQDIQPGSPYNLSTKDSGDDALPSPSTWAISANIYCGGNETKIGTGRDVASAANKRIVKIDGNVIRGHAELASVFSVMWLTPQMDGLFLAASSDRRKFLDRLVYNFNPEHASLVYSYEYSVRERAKLLQENGDPSWLSVLESKMAEKSVAIAIARIDAVNIIQDAINSSAGIFPKAHLHVEGYVESIVGNAPALETEELLKQKIRDARNQDARSGRTSIGTHRSDLCVTHIEKNMPAGLCSTGEQKALLLSIILAEARAKAMWKNNVPVLLLDEVVAHLDENRRNALFEEFMHMRAQVWMTGTDESLFTGLKDNAQFLRVNDGVLG